MEKDIYRKSRLLYIAEAALEYFVAILTQGTYFAKVATAVGIPDTLNNVLSALVTLASAFRIVSVFMAGKRPVKRYVTVLNTVNQLCFILFYLVPGFSIPREIKTVLFVLLILGGNILSQVVYSPKFNWFMTLVDDHKRGSFTATKEIVSLITGMIFTFSMGKLIDSFEEAGNIGGAFVVIAVTILILTVFHTATLIFSKEKSDLTPIPSLHGSLSSLFHNKKLLLVTVVPLLYAISTGVSTAFFATYWNNDLGFSMTFNSLLAAICSIVRAIASRPFGRFADKHSFASLLTICYSVAAAALLLCVFTVPANGAVMCVLYQILFGIAMAGINSGNVNLIYDYIEPKDRTGALAVSGSVCGLVGFLSTVLMAIPVEHIRANGNTLFGIPLYAQQLVAGIGCLLFLGIVVYIRLVIRKIRPVSDSGNEAA